MSKKSLAVLLSVSLIVSTMTIPLVKAEESLGDPILHWNDIALQAVAEDHTGTYGAPQQGGPGKTSRALAIIHAAIYDAVNSIDRTHESYLTLVTLPDIETASVHAAVANAAYSALVSLYSAQQSVFQAELSDYLAQIPDTDEKALGLDIGNTVAAAILLARSGDGADAPDTYTPSDDPGRHRKDPMNPGQPYLGPEWGDVAPFTMDSSSQFRAPAPPALDSEEYAEAFNEVKNLGGDGVNTPTQRTEEQMEIGLYWAYDGVKNLGTPPRLYNQIAQVIAEQEGNTIAENARLFALMNLAQADAGIASWESKYVYDYWRPVIAIREADAGTGPSGLGDNNPLTEGDTEWTPLGAPASNESNGGVNFTPPFPAYPSGHATFGAASFRTIANFYATDDIAFTFTSDELNGVTTDNEGNVRPLSPRSFTSLSQAAEENGQSRIYLGIHWSFDKTAGIDMGNAIADHMTENYLREISEEGGDEGGDGGEGGEDGGDGGGDGGDEGGSDGGEGGDEGGSDGGEGGQDGGDSGGEGGSEGGEGGDSGGDDEVIPPSEVQDEAETEQQTEERNEEESASHRGTGQNEAMAAIEFILRGMDPNGDGLSGHFSLNNDYLRIFRSELIASNRDLVGQLGPRDYSVLCSMRDFLHNTARVERSEQLGHWMMQELSSMLHVDMPMVEKALMGDGSMCDIPPPPPQGADWPVFGD